MHYNTQKLFFTIVGLLIVLIIASTTYRYIHVRQQPSPPPSPPTQDSNEQKELPSEQPDIPQTTVDDFVPFTFRAEHIIDFRSPAQWKQQHILGSIPIAQFDPADAHQATIALFADRTQQLSEILPHYNTLTAQAAQSHFYHGTLEEFKNHGGTVITQNDITDFVAQSKVTFVEPRDVYKAMTDHDDYIILDVRRTGNFRTAHVAGAQNFPEASLERTYKKIPRTAKTIYLYGADHAQSFRAGALLFDVGLFNIKTMRGGFAAWEKYGYPTTQ